MQVSIPLLFLARARQHKYTKVTYRICPFHRIIGLAYVCQLG